MRKLGIGHGGHESRSRGSTLVRGLEPDGARLGVAAQYLAANGSNSQGLMMELIGWDCPLRPRNLTFVGRGVHEVRGLAVKLSNDCSRPERTGAFDPNRASDCLD